MKKERNPNPVRGMSAKYAMTESFPEFVDHLLKEFLSVPQEGIGTSSLTGLAKGVRPSEQ